MGTLSDIDADIEADAKKALAEAKARSEPLDLTELEAWLAKSHEPLPRDPEAQREAWARRFAERAAAGLK